MTDSRTGSSIPDANRGTRRPLAAPHMETVWFDTEIWYPAQCSPYHSFLEIGSRDGTFLAYLAARKVTRFHGFDHEAAPPEAEPDTVRGHSTHGSLWQMLDDAETGPFDRVVMRDVLAHFPPDEAVRLLDAVRPRLNEGARLVVRVPNAASPWALQRQFGDLTLRTAFTPGSLGQLADAAGYELAAVWPQRRGSRRRIVIDALIHRFLSWALLDPPQLWSANFYGMLLPR